MTFKTPNAEHPTHGAALVAAGPCFVGIDPGQIGAIAVLDAAGDVLRVWSLPSLAGETEPVAFASLLRGIAPALCVVEHVGTIAKGAKRTNFSLGQSFGTIRGVTGCLCWATQLVRPSTWQPKVLNRKPRDKADTKDQAFAFCRRRWPSLALSPARSRVYHDGWGDALCLAEYARRQTVGG